LLAQAKGGKKVKKKLSVAFVLSVFVVLITVGAIAAVILSNRDFVEQVVAPIADETDSEKWNAEEVEQIIQLAENNGIVISDDMRAKIYNPSGRNKLELMRAFVSAELGPYIATWSIEDQAWFDEMMVRTGLLKQQTRFVPTDDEVSESVALDIAVKQIESEFKTQIRGSILESYKIFKEYRQFIDENNGVQPKKWFFHFEPNDITFDAFDVVVSAQGEAIQVKRELGVKGVSDVATAETVFDYYVDTYGMHYEWSQKVWESFKTDLQRSVNKYGHQINFTAYALKQEYGNPKTSSMLKQDAVDAAYKATAQSSGIDELKLRQLYKANALLLVGKEGLVWKISLVNTNPEGRRVFDLWSAEVNVSTSEVSNVIHYEPGKNSIYDAYYLIEILTDVSEWPAKG
ncbi:MAG: hypothetical protein Q4E22_07055, partial [Coriobacteriia bacterium]|nr:hypothetical protein [Coriobacteriia bacterium]